MERETESATTIFAQPCAKTHRRMLNHISYRHTLQWTASLLETQLMLLGTYRRDRAKPIGKINGSEESICVDF
jgi:hypothetical protein